MLTGRSKGLKLRTRRASGVRPTSSRVRNAIFETLPPDAVEGARVLDLYAGTGALGIEALSRGAESVQFVERDRRLCRLISENLEAAHAVDAGHVLCMNATKALGLLAEPYDLVLMDPPYGAAEVAQVLGLLESRRLLTDDATVVLEHAWRDGAIDPPGRLTLQRTRRYGDTALSYYQEESGA
ncbi:MAG: 16S rRNA (guanine(966)-N(2))-methyltransferase RsmD [Dehalococcoidia bacterium]